MPLQEPKINLYNIVRNYFNWCFENPDIMKPAHTAIYFYALDMNNRFGWKEKFGFPSIQAMEATSIKSKNTFYRAFNELVELDFIKIITKSKNQNTANIISISAVLDFKSAAYTASDSALGSALDSANIQQEDSGGNVDKQVTIKQKNQKQETENPSLTFFKIYEIKDLIKKEFTWKEALERNTREISENFNMKLLEKYLEQFFKTLENDGETEKTIKDFKKHFSRWLNKEINNSSQNNKNHDKGNNQKGNGTISRLPKKAVNNLSNPKNYPVDRQ